MVRLGYLTWTEFAYLLVYSFIYVWKVLQPFGIFWKWRKNLNLKLKSFYRMSPPQNFTGRTLTEVKAAEIKQLVEKVAPFCWAQHETFLPNWTLISIQSYVYNLIWKKETQSVKVSCIINTNILFDEQKNNLLMGTCEKNNG